MIPGVLRRGARALADTLGSARAHLLANLDDGSKCPCCGQFARRYKRKLNSDMARSLILIVDEYLHEPSAGWVDIQTIDVRGGDYAKLRHWGLLESRPNDDETKRTSGLWRPTELGSQFARGVILMPSHAYIYNNTVDGFTDSTTTIREALGDAFDYAELWKAR